MSRTSHGSYSVYFVLCLALLSASCSTVSIDNSGHPLKVSTSNLVDAVSGTPIDIVELAKHRAVFVGEQHDRLDHHQLQLSVIKALHANAEPLAIGLEFFQQPFQSVLDAYVSGLITENEMLAQTEYFERWGYDYRLYSPILRFAREAGIPVVALNLPGDVVRQTSRHGLESLDEKQRVFVPHEIDENVAGYEARIRESFLAHEGMDLGMLDNFVAAQLLWDEGMAEAAAVYLLENPKTQMVVLAGAGHIEYRRGIPIRLERRIGSSVATILPFSATEELDPERADFHIESSQPDLEPKGLMGIQLDKNEFGIYALAINDDSAAAIAGLKAGDVLRQINAQLIKSFGDVQLALWEAKPSETVHVTVVRKDENSDHLLEFELILK